MIYFTTYILQSLSMNCSSAHGLCSIFVVTFQYNTSELVSSKYPQIYHQNAFSFSLDISINSKLRITFDFLNSFTLIQK